MPDVSVIIPTYNRAGMVTEAIDSVIDQMMPDVQVVVVDDGSTDNTREVLNSRYGDRITYLHQPNSGRSAARNHGIAVSSGRYLLFLDSDDLLLPIALESEAAFLDTHPEVDVVYTDGYFCDEAGRQLARIAPTRLPHDPGNLLKDLILNNVILACHSAMVRRTALDSLGSPYFDETMSETEDQDFWVRLAARGKVFAYLDVPTCMYRLHSGNKSRADQSSPMLRVRQESVKHGRFKILYAGFFPELPVETRERFLYALLIIQLREDEPARNQVVNSTQFAELPAQVRARLLYHLGIRIILDEGGLEAGRRYLRRAVKLTPRNLKYRFMLMLSHGGHPVLGSLFGLRRWFRRTAPEESTQSPIGEGGLHSLSDVKTLAKE